MTETPSIEFYSIYEGAPLPTPASDDMMGLMPVRAAQMCLPLKSGSGLGYYVYPPADFALRWDGSRTELSWIDDSGEVEDWQALDAGAEAYLPFSESAPQSLTPERHEQASAVMDPEIGVSFINVHPRAQHNFEITTGLVIRTTPGWGVLVRQVANLPVQPGYQLLDGFVETDWYRGFVPVIGNLTVPGAIVRFFTHLPMAQLQLVSVSTLRADSRTSDAGIASWGEDVWAEFVQTRSERHATDRQRGTYTRAAKRAAANDRCPYPHGVSDESS